MLIAGIALMLLSAALVVLPASPSQAALLADFEFVFSTPDGIVVWEGDNDLDDDGGGAPGSGDTTNVPIPLEWGFGERYVHVSCSAVFDDGYHSGSDGSPGSSFPVPADEWVIVSYTIVKNGGPDTCSETFKTGFVKVEKKVAGDDSDVISFDFTSPEDFSLAADEVRVFGPYPVGTEVTFTEASLGDDWSTTSYCGEESPLVSNSVTFTIVEGDEASAAVCTFTNTYDEPEGYVTVEKVVAGEESGVTDFEFTSPEAFTLQDQGTKTFGPYPVGTVVTFTEEDLGTDWNTIASCGDASPVASSSVSFTIVEGDVESATVCTFTNTYDEPEGYVTVEKVVAGEESGVTDFEFTSPEAFTLQDQGTKTFGPYPVGTVVTFTEEDLGTDWNTIASCGDASPVASSSVSFTIVEGDVESATVCTFTNSFATSTTTAPTTTTVPELDPIIDLAIQKDARLVADLNDGNGTATIEWDITISHGATSEADAVGATVSDTAPDGITFVSVSGGLNCSIINNTLSCDPFDLALGDSVSLTIVSTTILDGEYVNMAVVDVDGDTVEPNNQDPADVELLPQVLGIEILPETGVESDALAAIAGLLMLLGAGLVIGSNLKRGESFTG